MAARAGVLSVSAPMCVALWRDPEIAGLSVSVWPLKVESPKSPSAEAATAGLNVPRGPRSQEGQSHRGATLLLWNLFGLS